MQQNYNLKHVFFDLDHTLWDFDKNSAITYQLIFDKMNLNIDLNHFLKTYTGVNLQLWKLFREDKIGKLEMRYKRLEDTFDAIGISVSKAQMHYIADEYILNLSEQTHLFDGTLRVLNYLKSKYKLHIITNGFADIQVRKLHNSNLKTFFDVTLDAETAGAKKPSPIIFKKALQLANAKKENSIMIGDSYEADILGALNIGMDAIYFNYHNEISPNNIKVIYQLDELIELL